MKRFQRDENGFVMILSLLMIPVFLAFGLLIVDLGRSYNVHGDLQAATDAMALAGARELDGGTDSVDRARAAMANVVNSATMVDATPRELNYDVSNTELIVHFLDEIPLQDTTPIDSAWIAAHEVPRSGVAQNAARYAYVAAVPTTLTTIFPLYSTLTRSSVTVAAVSVAKTVFAACEITPLYICNPFEGDVSGSPRLVDRFYDGDLHGRIFRLHPRGNSTHGPGSFGFLALGSGAADLNDIFAGMRNESCYGSESVDVEVKPGANTSLRQGINAKFDMYDAEYSDGIGSNKGTNFNVRVAENTRKGIIPDASVNGNNVNFDDCSSSSGNASRISDDHIWVDRGVGAANRFVFDANGLGYDGVADRAYGFPDNSTMRPPADAGSVLATQGAALGSGAWSLETYLRRNYEYPSFPLTISSSADGRTVTTNIQRPNGAGMASVLQSSFPNPSGAASYSGPGDTGPSRYDVYLWELANDLHELRAPSWDEVVGNGGNTQTVTMLNESGANACGQSQTPSIPATADPDPRIITAAIVDCGANPANGSSQTLPVQVYVSLFMARPFISYASSVDSTIDVEIVDIEGFSGSTLLDYYIREEAILVR
ncbi:TadE/TadG family type IV pilus assembly protein [Litorisediminicola beolgyonensis]|uniref:TadE/TadG family type IV pilus assembly protein n=1 Tax=Litorisediminicola beolgyonensis TaxID=1173614 RepID=A0ABW3ZDE9_9RHOB